MIIALGLIFTGVLFLLRNVNLLPDMAWGVVWPLTLIVLGGAIFMDSGVHSRGLCWPGCSCESFPLKDGKGKKRQ